eukprot:12480663-Alexandrium_andersonii.AAC.1
MSYDVCDLNCSCSTLVTHSFESLRPNRLFGASPAGELLAAAFFAEDEPLAFPICADQARACKGRRSQRLTRLLA